MVHETHVVKSPSHFHLLAYKVLGPFPSKIFPFKIKVREMLAKSYVGINHIIYISSMYFWSALIFSVSAVMAFFLSRTILARFGLILSPIQLLIVSLLLGLLCGGISMMCFLFYPKYVSSNLRMLIEKNLVYIVNYMAILSNAGATPWQIFSSLRVVGKIYGVEKIVRSILRNVEVLGLDIIMAIDEEEKRFRVRSSLIYFKATSSRFEPEVTPANISL